MDILLYLLIKLSEAVLGVLLSKLIEWVLSDRKPNPPEPNQDK